MTAEHQTKSACVTAQLHTGDASLELGNELRRRGSAACSRSQLTQSGSEFKPKSSDFKLVFSPLHY